MNDSGLVKREGADFSWRTALLAAFVLALVIALSDALLIALFELPRAATFLLFFFLKPLAAKVALVVAVYGILWFALLLPMGRAFRLDLLSLSVSQALFLFFINALFAVHSGFRFDLFMHDMGVTLFLCGGVITALAASAVSYFIAAALARSRLAAAAAGLCMALPFLLVETIILLRVTSHLIDRLKDSQSGLRALLSLPVLLTVLVYLAVAAATVLVFMRSNKIRPDRLRFPVRAVKVLVLVCIAGSILVLGTGAGETRTSPNGSSWNGHGIKHVVLVVIDTLRSDALSCYGGEKVSTPHIDRLAEDGIVFERAFAPAPWTVPSMASIMTGLSPLVHYATNPRSVIPDVLPVWAESMRGAGYETYAIGSQPYLAREHFLRGFMGSNFFPKRQDSSLTGGVLKSLFPGKFNDKASTSDLTRLAIDWLDENSGSDFFLWVHYYDPHLPYTPPEKHLPADRKGSAALGNRFSLGLQSIRAGYISLSEEERKWVRALYDSEVRYVDENVGLLLDHLIGLGIYDESLIVLTSDHGEEFWEHDGFEHGHSLYNELLSVPLIVKLPSSSAGARVKEKVSLEQVMPTVLDLCRIEYDEEWMSGLSLKELWSGPSGKNSPKPIVSTGLLYYENRESVIFNGMKYIRSLVTGNDELYDLNADPGEKHDVLSSEESDALKAREILSVFKDEADKLKKHYLITEGDEADLDRDTMQRLKELGYLD